jgi:hypothetical protein
VANALRLYDETAAMTKCDEEAVGEASTNQWLFTDRHDCDIQRTNSGRSSERVATPRYTGAIVPEPSANRKLAKASALRRDLAK